MKLFSKLVCSLLAQDEGLLKRLSTREVAGAQEHVKVVYRSGAYLYQYVSRHQSVVQLVQRRPRHRARRPVVFEKHTFELFRLRPDAFSEYETA